MDFGQLLLDKGLISPRELADALAEQRGAIVQGREPVPRLGEILVARGCLTERQVAEALATQQKAILHCPRCRIQVNVELRPQAAGYRCGTCGGELERPGPQVKNVTVVDTSVILIARDPLPDTVRTAAGEPARRFGKYVLLEEIGRGGAAIVHRAWDSYLNQYVALKFIRAAGGTDDEERVLSLLKEARSAIRLRHPNIVPIYDVGRIEKQFYIAMDCLEGRTLAGLMREARDHGRPSPLYEEPRRIVAALRDIARAVHYAHTRQTPVVHCDLKPSNIFVDAAWKASVLDFGLAYSVPEGGDAGLRGTPAYMAPELAAGAPAGIAPRVDIYGIGAILYELLSGRAPYEGTVPEVLRRVMTEPPRPPMADVPPAALAARPAEDVPLWPALERLCEQAMRRDPAGRPATARELAEGLDRLLKSESAVTQAATSDVGSDARAAAASPAPPAAPEPPRPGFAAALRPYAALAAGLIALVVATIALLTRGSSDAPEARDLRRRLERLVSDLRLDEARAAYAQAGTLLPESGRGWLEDEREDVEWLVLMRNRLVDAINGGATRPTATLRAGLLEIRDATLLHATREKLVVLNAGRAGEMPWSVLDADCVASLASRLLLREDARSSDRLALGIYCARNGLTDLARGHFESLAGTDLEVLARRHLARLEVDSRRGS